MTLRRLCENAALLLLLFSPTVRAVEALTTSIETVNAKSKIENLEKQKADLVDKRDRAKTSLEDLATNLKLIDAYRDLNAGRPGTTIMVFGEEQLRSLGTAKQALVMQHQAAAAEYSYYQSSLEQNQDRLHDLQALKISPNFQVNTGNSASAVVPAIDASGSFVISPNLDCQVLFSVKPDPPSGTTTDVAQSIRMATGVFSATFGMNYNHFWEKDDKPGADGPQGVEVRAGLPVAYQRASSTDASASPQSSTSTSDFGLLSPELKVSVWLKYALLGYRYAYYIAFGNSSAVYKEIDRTGSHKVYLATKLQALSGDTTPFYLEATYTSGKYGFSGGAFSFGVSKSLSWNPR